MGLFHRNEKDAKYHEKVEVTLTKSGIILRLIFLVIFLAIASFAFYSIFTKVLHTESGWQMVTANTKSTAGSEFAFHYQIGVSGIPASQEWGRLNKLYPSLLEEGYTIFGCEEAEGIGNLYRLNDHPNEEVYVEPSLYTALEKMQKTGSRVLFYAPVFAQYKALFSCKDEYEAADFDPFENEAVAEYLSNVCSYASEENHIRLELTESNTAKLVVSEEYLNYAKENEIENLIDFYYIKNAFVIDFVADKLIENGYKAGVITSAEGFVRALGEGDYSIKNYIYREGNVPEEQIYKYSGPRSLVFLRDFSLPGEDNKYYFVCEDGTVRHIFIDPETGLSREGLHQVVGSSEILGCSDILLPLYDAFVKEKDSVAGLNHFEFEVE